MKKLTQEMITEYVAERAKEFGVKPEQYVAIRGGEEEMVTECSEYFVEKKQEVTDVYVLMIQNGHKEDKRIQTPISLEEREIDTVICEEESDDYGLNTYILILKDGHFIQVHSAH